MSESITIGNGQDLPDELGSLRHYSLDHTAVDKTLANGTTGRYYHVSVDYTKGGADEFFVPELTGKQWISMGDNARPSAIDQYYRVNKDGLVRE